MKKYIVLGVLICFLFNGIAMATDYSVSDWAYESVMEMKDYKVFREEAFKNYKNPITRSEFIYFAVRLYELIDGNEIVPDASITFNDTDDLYAIKGASVGITSGIGGGNFGPSQLLTREQLAVLMMNIITKAGLELESPRNYQFSDEADFSDWAIESIYLAWANGIISGVGNDRFDPSGHASVEAAIVITNRILKDNELMLVDISPDDLEYEMTEDGIRILEYTGSDVRVRIPSRINNLPVTEIGAFAFAWHELTRIEIPETVTNVAAYAFYKNKISSLELPNTLESLGWGAFTQNSLKSIRIPNAMVEIGPYAFSQNQLSTIEFHNAVEKVSYASFGSNQLTSVTLPNSTGIVEAYAFSGNPLEQVLVSPECRYETTSFDTCTNIIGQKKSFQTPEEDFLYEIEGGEVYIQYYIGQSRNIIIPDEIEGNPVTTIGSLAFCEKEIDSVTIGKNVKTIEWNVFLNSTLKSVDIPESIVEIGRYAFENTQLREVEIPSSVTQLGRYIFNFSNTPTIEALNRYVYNRYTYDESWWEMYLNYNTFDSNAEQGPVKIDRNTEVHQLSDEITKGLVRDYDKLLAIYNWVGENIYYDYDRFYSNTYTYQDSIETIRLKKGVCSNYALCLMIWWLPLEFHVIGSKGMH